MRETRPFDLSIRLPTDKKHLKQKLLKIAESNHITMNQLVIYVIEWFLEEKKQKRQFVIKIK